MKNKISNRLLENRERIADALSLPQDIISGASIITVTGTMQVLIENYKGILECTCERVVLQGKHCKICVLGKRLCVRYYNSDDMLIVGKIETIQYSN